MSTIDYSQETIIGKEWQSAVLLMASAMRIHLLLENVMASMKT